MKTTHTTSKTAVFAALVVVAALLVLAFGPSGASPAGAAPRGAITPSPEPDPPTAVPTATTPPTPVPPTSVPTETPPEDDGRTDPLLEKSVDPSSVRTGDVVVFTLTVSNLGDERAEDVVVTDPLPAFFTVLDAETERGSVAIHGNAVTATLGTLSSTDVIRIRIRARVNGGAPSASNTATLTTSSGDNDIGNDMSGVTVVLLDFQAATPTLTLPPEAVATPVTPTGDTQTRDTNAPAPQRAAPRQQLPRTGAPVSAGAGMALIVLGLAGVVAGFALRRR
jgi:uncharacterized repeat protein (TIGR01451 family)